MKVNKKNMVEELTNRNPHALELAMDIYMERVYSLIYRVLKDVGAKEDIEECVSDTFVEVWESISKYDPKRGSFDTWVFVLAKYKALDFRRTQYKKIETQPLEHINVISKENTEDEAIVKDQQREILNGINSLARIDKEIFCKRYFFYESIESIAGYYGLSKGAVYKRLWRSKDKLIGFLQNGEV